MHTISLCVCDVIGKKIDTGMTARLGVKNYFSKTLLTNNIISYY
jgi:hypothetical protein